MSVCSGIEAATVAWHPLGWSPAAFSEIEAFPRAVLRHHYPAVPIHGDFTTIEENEYGTIDLLVGGTPCQSFSVAGLRKGLADDRGNLSLEFIRLAKASRARWVVWENVPGVLSIDGGRAFGSFLGGLAECGYGFAYRILDAQYFGVPQRRRRVFVVGYLGDWRPAAAVLFEREGLRGDITPRRKAREEIAPTISARTTGGGGLGSDFDCDGGLVTHTLRGDGFDASEDGTGRGTPLVAGTVSSKWAKGTGGPSGDECQNLIAFNLRGREGGAAAELTDVASLRASSGGSSRSYVGFAQNQRDEVRCVDVAGALAAETGMKQQTYVNTAMRVRRLTPTECERLMGFPDDYTLVPFRGKLAADGNRYKALGNSMAVPVMRWIGQRIEMVNSLL